MKIPGDNNKSKAILGAQDNTARKISEETKVAKKTDSDAVVKSFANDELAKRRERIEFLKAQHDNKQLDFDSRAVARSLADTLDEEIFAEKQLAQNS